MGMKIQKAKCCYCGYEMPVWYKPNAESHGLQLKCKNPKCRREFELIIRNGEQRSN